MSEGSLICLVAMSKTRRQGDGETRSIRSNRSLLVSWSPSLLVYSATTLSSLLDPIAEEVVQLGDVVDLVGGHAEIVVDAAEGELAVFLNDVAGAVVAVARLADRADVDHELLAVVAVDVVDGLSGVMKLRLSVNTPGTCVWPWKQPRGTRLKSFSIFFWL